MGAKNVAEVTPPEFGLGYHPSGATAMGNSPDDGVCDPDLKVFGLSNLYLVSNSVFPHMGANPPTLTIGVREVDLNGLPPEERELLLTLVKQLYNFVEVRFLVSGEPPWGECPEDRLHHTQAPISMAENSG